MLSRQYVPIIDLVRCFAALIVAALHFLTTWPHPTLMQNDILGYPDFSVLNGVFYFGFVGVEIFFVISGYVIAASSQGRDARQFLSGRLQRIVPILWLSIAVGAALLLAHGGNVIEIVQRSLVSATLSPIGTPLDAVVWTLTIEIVFYAVVWTLLVLNREAIGTNLIHLAGVMAVASLINVAIEIKGAKLGNRIPSLLLLRHGGFFALGITIWKWPEQRHFLVAGISLASCLLAIWAQTSDYNVEAGTDFSAFVPLALWLVASVIIFFGATHPKANVSRLVRTLGLMTYPIYLLHRTVGGTVIASLSVNGVPPGLAVAIGFAAVLVGSWVVVDLVEPALRPHFRGVTDRVLKIHRPSPG